MMTAAGAIFLVFSLLKWWIGEINADGAFPLFFGLPFLVSCILSDFCSAYGMACIEKINY